MKSVNWARNFSALFANSVKMLIKPGFAVLLGASALPTWVSAYEVDAEKFQVYYGDFNNDGNSDIYFNSLNTFTLLHGDIVTPLLLPRDASFILYGTASGGYQGAITVEYSSSNLASATLAGENTDYYIADFDGDGINDIFVRGQVLGPNTYATSVIVTGVTGSNAPTLATTYNAVSGTENLADRSVAITIQDVDSDGRADIVTSANNVYMLNQAYAVVEQGSGIVDTSATNPANDSLVGTSVYYGALKGNHSVGADGSFNYSIPIEVPPGINGLEPKISLNYNSNRRNGLVGWGWSIGGLSAITRCPASHVRDGYVSGINPGDNYKFCLDGQRLVEISPREYRTEVESFTRIKAVGGTAKVPDYWVVEMSDGHIHTYGGGNNAEVLDGAAKTMEWHIRERKDVPGNAITYNYVYSSSAGTHYLSSINYAAGVIDNSILFEYENSARPDVLQRYIAGAKRVTDKRLSAIQVKSNGARVKKYSLNYQQWDGVTYADPAKVSRVSTIQLCYSSDSECAKKAEFLWSDASDTVFSQFTSNSIDDPDLTTSDYPDSLLDYNSPCLYWKDRDYGDFNGDGKLDRISQASVRYGVSPFLGERYGFSKSECNAREAELNDVDEVLLTTYGQFDLQRLINDFNNDGYMDVGFFNPGMPDGGKVFLGSKDGLTESSGYSLDSSETRYQLIQKALKSPVVDVNEQAPFTFKYADFNGDGLIDIARYKAVCPPGFCEDKSVNAHAIEVSLNSGEGFGAFVKWADKPGSWRSMVHVGDVNGDGLADLIGYQGEVALNENGSFSFSTEWAVLSNFFEASDYYDFFGIYTNEYDMVGDVNGDGLTDIITIRDDGTYVWLSTGKGFNARQLWSAEITRDYYYVDTTLKHNAPKLVDINNDGMMDLWFTRKRPGTNNVAYLAEYIAYSKGFAAGSLGFSPKKVSQFRYAAYTLWDYYYTYQNGPPQFYDADSDGYVDAYQGNQKPHLLKQVLLNRGVNGPDIEIEYSPLGKREVYSNTDGPEGVGRFLQQPVTTNQGGVGGYSSPYVNPSVLPVGAITFGKVNGQYKVALVKVATGADFSKTRSYKYANKRRNLAGFGDLGFERVEVTEQVNNTEGFKTVTEFLQIIDFSYDYKMSGKPKRKRRYYLHDQNGAEVEQLLSDTRYKWEVRVYEDDVDASSESFNSPHIFPYLSETSEARFDLDGSALGNKKYYSYKATSPSCSALSLTSVQSITNTTFGSAADNHYSPEGVPFYELNITCGGTVVGLATENIGISSIQTSDRWVLGQIDRVKQHAWTGTVSGFTGDGDEVRTTGYTYYDASSTFAGNVKSTTREPNGGNALKLTTSYTYDPTYGGIASVTETAAANTAGDFTSRVMSYSTSYNASGEKTVIETNPLLHEATTRYSADYGLPVSQTDANNLTVNTTYDVAGRPTLISGPDGNTTIDYRSCTNCFDYSAHEQFFVQSKTDGEPAVRTYYDALGREVGMRSKGLTGSYTYAYKQYDDLGRVVLASDPFFSGDTANETAFDYDVLNRLELTTYGDATTSSTTYAGLTQTTSNRQGQSQTKTLNGAGWVYKVVDNAGTPVDYTYTAFGDLETTKVNNNAATTVTIGYDTLGRKTSLDDPNTGIVGYTYNAFGVLATSTDANGNTSAYTYDKLDRQLSLTVGGATQYWAYDTAPLGSDSTAKGLLASLSGTGTDGTSHSETYTYTSDALLHAHTVNIGTQTYRFETFYDTFNRQVGFSYPSGLTLQYHYNSYGYRDEVSSVTHDVTLWQASEQDARGNLTQFTAGVGDYAITTDRTYTPVDGRINTIHAYNASTNNDIQDHEYQFSALGNLTRRQDFINNINECFSYDSMNRLKDSGFAGSCAGAEAYRYNALGNITSKTGVSGTYAYGSAAGPNAVTAANGLTYEYDAAGNMVKARNGADQVVKQVTYTAFNKPSYISANGQTTSLVYGANQSRIKQTDSSGRVTTYPALGLYEIVQDNGNTQQVHYLEDWGMFTVEDAGAYYQTVHRDHLGSVIAKVGQFGDVEELSNGAWGERRSANWSGAKLSSFEPLGSARGYTDHEHLDTVGLIHMNGRVYDPVLGRFLSPDPLVQAPYNTQSYNRYSYVFNNPLSFTDPTGYTSYDGGSGGSELMEEVVATGERRPPPPPPGSMSTYSIDYFIGVNSGTGDEWMQIGTWSFNLAWLAPIPPDVAMAMGPVESSGGGSDGISSASGGSATVYVLATGVRAGNMRGPTQENKGIEWTWFDSYVLGGGLAATAPDGSFGVTSKGSFRFYSNGWRGNQYIKTWLTQSSKWAKPLSSKIFALSALNDVNRVRNDELDGGRAAVNISFGALGIAMPIAGFAGFINDKFHDTLGPHLLDGLIKAGAQPEIVGPNYGL